MIEEKRPGWEPESPKKPAFKVCCTAAFVPGSLGGLWSEPSAQDSGGNDVQESDPPMMKRCSALCNFCWGNSGNTRNINESSKDKKKMPKKDAWPQGRGRKSSLTQAPKSMRCKGNQYEWKETRRDGENGLDES